MKAFLCFALFCLLAAPGYSAPLEEKILSEALIVTKAELRRHMAASDDDTWKPALFADLELSRGDAQPDYLVVRFRATVPGHYFGEAEAKINGSENGTRLNVVLHYNKGWVEYFIPMDGVMYGPPQRDGSPSVVVVWNHLKTK